MELIEFKNIFKEKSKKTNINISDENIEKLYKYMNILLEWNNKMNLTAITDEKDIIVKHFLDSLTILEYIKENSTIIDIGTGAGFPGIPIAINSNAKITLVDSLNKRVNFLNEVKNQLNLENINNIHGRAEEIGKQKEHREMYDIAVSRAVAPMNILLEYLLPLVKVGGICICMKGPNVNEELEFSKKALKELGGKIKNNINIKFEDESIKRNLVFIEKIKKTPNKYPRKPGTPKKEPL